MSSSGCQRLFVVGCWLASRVRCHQLGWELTRVYGCWRGVAGGAAPGYSHLQPPSPGGGLRVNIIQTLRKQSANPPFSSLIFYHTSFTA